MTLTLKKAINWLINVDTCENMEVALRFFWKIIELLVNDKSTYLYKILKKIKEILENNLSQGKEAVKILKNTSMYKTLVQGALAGADLVDKASSQTALYYKRAWSELSKLMGWKNEADKDMERQIADTRPERFR